MSKNWHPFAILLAGVAVSQLSVGIATVGAVDGANGTSGPAMIDVDTGQLFDSQHPDHVLVAGTQTLTLTGHGTHTLTSLGVGTLYGTNGIGFVNTNTVTTTGSYTQTTTNTIPATITTTVSGTGTVSGTNTISGTSTQSQSVTITMPSTFTSTYAGTPPTTTGTSTRTNSRIYTYTGTATVSTTLTSTATATASGTGTATGTGTGTGTVTGTVSGSQTASGTKTASMTGSGATTETVSNTQTVFTTMTVTASKTWTATGSSVVTATQNTIAMTATDTGTGTWTNTHTGTANTTGTFTATNTFTVTTTSNSASVSSNPTIAHTNVHSNAFMIDNDGCNAGSLGVCPVAMWVRHSQGGVPYVDGLTSASGVVQLGGTGQGLFYYDRNPTWPYDLFGTLLLPAGTWTIRARAAASSLRYRSYIRIEVVVVGLDTAHLGGCGACGDPGKCMTCDGNVTSVIPTGIVMDFPVTMQGGDSIEFTLPAYIGGASASVEQTTAKHFAYEPDYPSGWNTPCSYASPCGNDNHTPVSIGVRVSAYTESTDPVSVYFFTADLDAPIPVLDLNP